MAVSSHLVILLLPVLYLCGATEYYVRPTEPTNTSCPAQPCLTLSQYTSDSDHYFKSNTVFKFLPGTHHMKRSITIGNIYNMSWESLSDTSDEYPHLVAQFSCEVCDCTLYWNFHSYYSSISFIMCCATVCFHDMHNVTVKGLHITVQTSNELTSAVTLKNVSGSTIQLNTTCSGSSSGIILHEAKSVEVYSSSVNNCGYGLVLHKTSKTHITKVTTVHNKYMGLAFYKSTDIHINNTISAHNTWDGMYLSTMSNTLITNMTARNNSWCGIKLSVMSNTYISNATATHNDDVGVYVSASNNTRMTKTTATDNGKNVFHSLIEVFDGQIILAFSKTTLIYNTSFTDIVSAQSTSNTADPTSLPAVITLYQSTLLVSGCDFTRNNISAMGVHASNVTVSGNLTFSDNKAFAGTAFILVADSILTSAENSHVYFLNNHATNTGGVFYISNNNMYLVRSGGGYYPRNTCFVNTAGSRSQTRFTFVNNSARKGGDILYGGHVAIGLDGNRNCLDSFKSISNISQSGLSLISSDPTRVCLCNGTGQPDCLVLVDLTPLTVYPGQTISIPAVVVGQDFGTISGSVYAQFLERGSPPQLESGQEVQSVTQHNCNNLWYTIFTQSEVSEAVLVLTAKDSYVSKLLNGRVYWDTLNQKYFFYKTHAIHPLVYSNNPVYVNISLLPCPPGFMLTTDPPFKCDCDELLQQMHGIHCHIQEQTISRSGLLWVGMIRDNNGTNGTLAASEYCPSNYCNKENSNVKLSKPDSQCNFNHSGILCGRCQPGLSLAVGSTQCLRCSNKYLALLIPLTMAGPLLVFFIKLLDLTISQGTLNGLIFYANVVRANEHIFFPQGQTNPLTVFIAWLNLDLGVETCFFQGLTAYSKTWLQFVFPIYIWSIAGLIIILARYSDRVAKVMGNNSVPVLATLFLLSYAKLLRTIITALSYTFVYTSHGPKAVWTADGNVDYLGPQHVPLFAASVAVLLFLWLPYTLLIFLGQWLHRCNCQLIACMLIKTKPFLDAHYGPVKNKHHYWFGALLVVRAAILLISALIPVNRSSVVVLSISVISVVLTHYGHLVYRTLVVAMFDITFFMNLALLTGAYSFTATAGGDLAVSTYTLIGIAFIQFVGLVLFKVFSILKLSEKLMGWLHRKQLVEDDWELYEEAARQREMESDMDEQDSKSSGSNESLPTY